MTNSVISALRAELAANTDPQTQASGERFFKEAVKLYGVKTVIVGRIGARHFPEIKHLPKTETFALCEELLKSDYMEESFIAFDWADRLRREYEIADFEVFERWLNLYVNNWAKCDTLCNHTIAGVVDRFPELVERLKVWARSENRWVRRGAAVTLILPGRAGKFLPDVFQIADTLLMDKDDLVQKGYGWMLKEASRKHQNEVFGYIIKHKAVMPRTALRYAIEKMPEELRKQAMAKG